MKKKEEEIDNLFKNNVEPFEMNPPKKAWVALDAELDRKQAISFKKQAYRYKLISLSLFLLLISFITFQYFVPHTNEYIAERDSKNTSTITSLNPLITSSESRALSDKNESLNSSIPTGNNNVMGNTPPNSASPTIIASYGEKAGNIINNMIPLKKERHLLAKKQKIILNRKNNDSENQAIENIQTTTANSISSEHVKIAADSVNKIPQNNNTLTANSTVVSEIQKADSVELLQTSATNKISAIASTNIIPISKNGFDWSKFSVSAFFSPDFNYRHLIDNDANEAQHLDHRRAKDYDGDELPDFSFTAGSLAKYDLTSRWSIQSGCTYSVSVRKIKPATIYAEQGTNSEAHYILNTSLGTAELPNSPNAIPQIGDSVNLKTNSKQILRFINIPLIVRFQFVKNRFSYYACSGLSANILIKEQSEVSIENPTSETIIISNINGLKPITYSFLLGIGAQYNFYKNISAFIEPMFRKSITSINQNTSVTSYPYSIGFNMGFVCHF